MGTLTRELATVDLSVTSVRELNGELHAPRAQAYEVLHPQGAHALAAGLKDPISVDIRGHAGYYAAGMNDGGTVTVHGNVGTGVAENMMLGTVRVTGDASQSAGATAHGGLLVIEGSASMRCGISMKGVDIVVGGSIGHMSAFMGQKGALVVCGDAGHDLGDSLYEAEIFVGGTVASLGADCIEKEMTQGDVERVAGLLDRAGMAADVTRFRHYGSARRLYNFHIDHATEY